MWFKSYEHFHYGRTDGSHTDCSANLRVVQYCFSSTVEIIGKYRLEQSVSVRALPEVIVGDAWAAVAFFSFLFLIIFFYINHYYLPIRRAKKNMLAFLSTFWHPC